MMEGGVGLDSVCYENHMLRDWMASAGVVQHRPDRGKPRRLMKVQKNSLAVLREYSATLNPLSCNDYRAEMGVPSARLFTENTLKPLHSANRPALRGQACTVLSPYAYTSARLQRLVLDSFHTFALNFLSYGVTEYALLTTRDPNSSEDTRYIFAVFLVDDSHEGDHKDAGYVTTFYSWKIEPLPQEARKMKFWTYYANSNRDVIAFSSGLFRYLSDNQAAQILCDIKEIRAAAKDREFAEHFLEHFCKINGISVTEIPTLSGALIRK